MKKFKAVWNFKSKEQIARLLGKTIEVREKSFLKDFSWTPITLYNEATQLNNESKGPFLAKWMATLDRFLKGEPIDQIEPSQIKFTMERIGKKYHSVIEAKVAGVLWFWLWNVIKGDLIVRICEAEDCVRIFTPTARLDQTFCSNRCRMRITMRRIKKRKELRTRKAEESRLSLSKSS
ncbi:hypothetical protein ES707_08123 [subsurface metagenome]